MIGLRPFLLRTAASSGEGALDDIAAFWAAVEWNAYLRRGTMLAVCMGTEPMEAPDHDARFNVQIGDAPMAGAPKGMRIAALPTPDDGSPVEVLITRTPLRDHYAPPPADSWE